jgi:hypothetical protein
MRRSLFRPSAANAIEYYIDKNQFFHPLSDTHYSIIVVMERIISGAGKLA